MKVSKLCNLRSLMLAVFLLTTAVSCGSKGANPFSKSDGQVDENVANLMGLAVGMTKGQVYDLVGVANYMEGYDWGSVWRYKIKKGGKSGTLANKEVESNYMPVVFDNTDRVMGYGQKFYDQTLSDLGTGQF
jgi:hypothetical protein